MVSIPLLLMSSFSSAATVNGWPLSNPTAQGASTLYDAYKTLTNGIAKSSALITPAASDVSKVLVRGAGGYALTFAVEQLLGAVDWVMDPANNQVVYYEQPKPINSMQYPWYVRLTTNLCFDESSCLSAIKANEDYQQTQGAPWGNYIIYEKCTLTDKMLCTGKYRGSGDFRSFELPRTLNPNYDPNAKPEEKKLPLETVAEKVISNADANDTNAQVATMAAAGDIANDAETNPVTAQPIIEQLEANAILAGSASGPNKISHGREDEVLAMSPYDPCDELKKAIEDLDETLAWRKSDLNKAQKGTKVYVGHQQRRAILREKRDRLQQSYNQMCL